MKRIMSILLVLFCFSTAGHAQENTSSITLDRKITQLTWSPDSRYIAFLATEANDDTNIQVIEVSTGRRIADFDYAPSVIAWSPDSTRLVVNTSRDTGQYRSPGFHQVTPITILDIKTGGELEIGSDVDVNGLAWSPDGIRLAVTTSRYDTSDAYTSSVQIWDLASEIVVSILVNDESWINRYWYAPVWSPSGTRLAVPNADGSLAIWDVARQKQVIDVWGFFKYTQNVAWNPRGDRIAASHSETIRTWDATTGEPLSAIPGYSTSKLCWTEDEQLAVVESNRVTFIEPVSGFAVGSLEADIPLENDGIYWSPDGQYIAYPDGNNIHIVSPTYTPAEATPVTLTLRDITPELLSTLPNTVVPITTTNADQLTWLGQFGRDDISDVLWSPDGNTIALKGTHGIWLYDDPSLNQPPHLLEVADGTVSVMRFSPDSRYLILALENETTRDFGIRFWDLQANQIARVLNGHTGPVTALEFSADGHLLATGSADLTIRLWNLDTGELLHVLWDHVDAVLSVHFNSDGSQLVSAGDDMVRLWDVEAGTLIDRYNGDWSYEGQDPRVVNAFFTPDGSAAIFYYLDLRQEFISLRWRFLNKDEERFYINPFGRYGYVGSGPQYEIAFSPDGTSMIPYASTGSYLTMLDVNTGEEIKKGWELVCIVGGGSVAFSSDGTKLAVGVTGNMACDPHPENEPNTIWLWNMPSFELRAVLRGHVAPIDRLAFSPDGNRLLSVSTDNTIRLWDTATGEALKVLTDYSNPASYLSFDALDTLTSLEIARDAAVIRRNGQPIRGVNESYPVSWPNSPLAEVYSSQDMSVLITHEDDLDSIFNRGAFTIWNVTTNELLRSLSVDLPYHFGIAINPDGTLFATHENEVVKLWRIDTKTEPQILLDEQYTYVRSLAFSPNGQYLAGVLGQYDAPGNAVQFWDLAAGTTRRVTLPDPEAKITSLFFSPDSRYLAVQTAVADVWVLSLQAITEPVVLHPGGKSIECIAFSQDAALVALGTDQGLQLWDHMMGIRLVTLPAKSVSMAFNKDNTLLASGEADGTIQLWGILGSDR